MDLGHTFALDFLVPVNDKDNGALITPGGAVLAPLLVKHIVFSP